MSAFRRATVVDVPRVVALVESAYRGDQSRAGWTTEADLIGGQRTDAQMVHALVAASTSRIILVGEPPVGSVLLEVQGDAAYIGMLAVSPTLQTRGTGSALLAEAERQAKVELRLTRARMTVVAQRPELLAFYGRRGYQPTGERREFPYGDPRHGEPRRDDLYFVVLEKTL